MLDRIGTSVSFLVLFLKAPIGSAEELSEASQQCFGLLEDTVILTLEREVASCWDGTGHLLGRSG
jgi:hypothetical protein